MTTPTIEFILHQGYTPTKHSIRVLYYTADVYRKGKNKRLLYNPNSDRILARYDIKQVRIFRRKLELRDLNDFRATHTGETITW